MGVVATTVPDYAGAATTVPDDGAATTVPDDGAATTAPEDAGTEDNTVPATGEAAATELSTCGAGTWTGDAAAAVSAMADTSDTAGTTSDTAGTKFVTADTSGIAGTAGKLGIRLPSPNCDLRLTA